MYCAFATISIYLYPIIISYIDRNLARSSIAWMDGFVLYIVGDKEKIGTVECLDTRSYSSNWVLANKDLQVDRILGACTLKRLFCNNIY